VFSLGFVPGVDQGNCTEGPSKRRRADAAKSVSVGHNLARQIGGSCKPHAIRKNLRRKPLAIHADHGALFEDHGAILCLL
jgi:hypothetical protein